MQAGSWSARQLDRAYTYRRQVYLSPYACLFKMTTKVTIKWNSLGNEVAAVAVLCACSYFLLQFSRIWCFSHRVSYNRTMKIRWSPGTLARQCPEDASVQMQQHRSVAKQRPHQHLNDQQRQCICKAMAQTVAMSQSSEKTEHHVYTTQLSIDAPDSITCCLYLI